MLESGVGPFRIRFVAGGDLYPGKNKTSMMVSDTRNIRNEGGRGDRRRRTVAVRTQLEPLTVRPVAWSLAKHLGIFDR